MWDTTNLRGFPQKTGVSYLPFLIPFPPLPRLNMSAVRIRLSWKRWSTNLFIVNCGLKSGFRNSTVPLRTRESRPRQDSPSRSGRERGRNLWAILCEFLCSPFNISACRYDRKLWFIAFCAFCHLLSTGTNFNILSEQNSWVAKCSQCTEHQYKVPKQC